MKQRILGLDLLRVVAMIFVIIDHTIVCGLGADDETMMHIIVGDSVLFFMISGAVLLPVEGSGVAFLKKRFKRIFPPFFIWSVVYLLLSYYFEGWTLGTLWKEFYSLPLKPSFGAAWFMYALMGFYLMAPIISVWLNNTSRRWVEYVLVLWALSTTIPYACYFVEFPQNIHDTVLSPFVGYLGYMLLGYYLYRYPLNAESSRYKTVAWAVLLMLAVVLPVRLYFFTEKYGLTYMLHNDQHINIVAYMAIYFILIIQVKRLPRWIEMGVTRLAKLSFGIYLCHTAIYEYVVLPHMYDCEWAMLIAPLATFLASTLLIYLLSLTPMKRYVC
ncbi:MAG: acyltransferase [Muribaculaceae bacterium]|nr:acyltransferase [Muribaculaceae bacterium]